MELVQTFQFIKEKARNSSVPMLFICETAQGTLERYWLKYARRPEEFDCLVYELVCQELARQAGLCVPDVALATVVEGSFAPGALTQNPALVPGVVAFASRNLALPHEMLSKLNQPTDPAALSTYEHPLDVLRIALFDLHVGNRDRTEENFNLLITDTKPQQVYVIDHFDCFGSVWHLGRVAADLPFNIHETILRAPICQQAIALLKPGQLTELLDQYQYLCRPAIVSEVLTTVFASLPAAWPLSADLEQRLLAVLANSERLAAITGAVSAFIQH